VKPMTNSQGAPQVVSLTPAELTNLVKEAVISILLVHGLTKEKLLAEFQQMLTKAVREIVPLNDPEETEYLNATEAAKFLDTSRTTVTKYKKEVVNGEPVLKFGGVGKIKKISKAECRRVMAANIINVRKTPPGKKKKQ
jgi:hypothetical protein